MKLPAEIREQFRQQGRQGGLERARRLSPARRRSIARHAVVSRWIRQRFGVGRFADMALPGADLVDEGLRDLSAERESVASLLISLAACRLRREGVPVPADTFTEPESRLYQRLLRDHQELAHYRYLALLEQIRSFADASAVFRRRHAN